MSSFSETFLYIWPIIKKYKWQFYAIFVVNALRLITSSIVSPLFYKRVIDVISRAGVLREGVASALYQSIFFLAIVLPMGWFFGRATQYLVSTFQSSVLKDLHDFSFKKLHAHSYTFFTNNFAGALVNKSRKFVRAFEVMHDISIDNFWSSFVLLASVFIVFLLQAPVIAFMFLGMSIVYIFIVLLMSSKKVEYDLAEAAADSMVTATLADSITNTMAIKASSALDREIVNFNKVTKREADLRLRSWFFGNKLNAIQSAMSLCVQIIVAFLAGYFWLSGKISAGLFVLVQSYSVTIGQNFWDLGKASTKFTKAFSDMREMVEIFKHTPDVSDTANPEQCKITQGVIEIKNIQFVYLNGTRVFDNFSLKINSGEKIGLVGHSGSGKSTITKLLMRFIDISSGDILIDGQNIIKITQDDLHKNISYISQEPILFHRTIYENISYDWPEASEEQVVESAKKAHAHEFIKSLPNGYNTLVGERGVKLSGGERQRVAIARAMLKPAPILILDEATSSLDSISEHYIQEAFDELMKDKTTIVIAHRLSTIQKMDRIIVLDRGNIVEEGTHKELIAKEGLYKSLWDHQTGGFLE